MAKSNKDAKVYNIYQESKYNDYKTIIENHYCNSNKKATGQKWS